MAALARRAFPDLLAEAKLRLLSPSYTGFDARVQHWVQQAYLSLALTVQHPVLQKSQVVTLVGGANIVALPAAVCYVIAVRSLDGTTYKDRMTYAEAHSLLVEYAGQAGEPTRYSRFGQTLIFNRKPAANRSITLYYYAYPATPDFASGSSYSELEWWWDEPILQLACVAGWRSVGRQDLAQAEADNLERFLQGQPYPRVQEGRLVDLSAVNRSAAPLGGPAG